MGKQPEKIWLVEYMPPGTQIGQDIFPRSDTKAVGDHVTKLLETGEIHSLRIYSAERSVDV
jgi:hypothetical protein